MNHSVYRLKYGSREIFFEPIDRCVTVRDKKTKRNGSLTHKEELNVLLHLYILEAYEKEGKDSDPEDISIFDEESDKSETVEDLIHAIERTKKVYGLEDINILDPSINKVRKIRVRPSIGVTVFPAGWQNYPDHEKIKLYLDFMDGKLDYLHVEI